MPAEPAEDTDSNQREGDMAVTTQPNNPDQQEPGATISSMTPPSKHAKTRDHLWVLAIIAVFALVDVVESWTQVGDKSGYAHGTSWTLTVIVEAFAAYSLWAWFTAPGKRSRRFAMCSALGVLALSLVGQGASVLAVNAVPPLWLRVFVKDLPVIVLALIAIMVELRRQDRARKAKAEEAAAKADALAQANAQLASLRAQIAAHQEQLDAAEIAHRAELDSAATAHRAELETAATAQQQAEQAAQEALTRADQLAAKVARMSDSRKRTRKQETAPEDDLSTEFRAVDELRKDASLRGPRMGAELARRLGVSEAHGRRLHSRLAPVVSAQMSDPGAPENRSSAAPDERLDERS